MQIDPFLSLVGDSKLQVVDTGSRLGNVDYGSKEDDSSAMKCLSEIEITKDQTREHMVSIIVKSLDNLLDVNVHLNSFESMNFLYFLINETILP